MYKQAQSIHQGYVQKSNAIYKNQSLEQFLDDNKEYFSLSVDIVENNKEEYVPIRANISGFFRTYDTKMLQVIVNKIEENKIKENEYKSTHSAPFILTLAGGIKINRGVIVAYYKNEYKDYKDLLLNSVVLIDSARYPDDKIDSIVKDLFSNALASKDGHFDVDSRLYNFFNFLYENDMSAIREYFYEYIKKLYIDYRSDYNMNKELAHFLRRLMYLARSNKDYERYKYLSDYVCYFYSAQLKNVEDYREVAYDYTSSVISFEFYAVRNIENMDYYDVLLSNLMKFIFDLLDNSGYSAINDIFENVIFDYNYYISGDPNQKDILKMQFSYGIIYGLVAMTRKKLTKSDNSKGLRMLINLVDQHFTGVLCLNDAFLYFRQYYHMPSCIQNYYRSLDYKYEKDKYRSHCSWSAIGDVEVLREYIYCYNIRVYNKEKIDSRLIDKDYTSYYKSLLARVKDPITSVLDSLLGINYNDKELIEFLEELIRQCEISEEDYLKSFYIGDETVNNFKNDIILAIEDGNSLTRYLSNCDRFNRLKLKGTNLFGYTQLVDRDMFSGKVAGLDNVARSYGKGIVSGITKDYLKKLDDISETIKIDLSSFINSLNKNEKYVVITSPSNRRIIGKENLNKTSAVICGKKVDLIKLNTAMDTYFIRKRDLPKIDLFKPSAKKNASIENNILCELVDCSKDNSTRKEIQKNAEWLREKGSKEEQLEYLRSKMLIKLLVSYSIKPKTDAKCYKYISSSEDSNV